MNNKKLIILLIAAAAVVFTGCDGLIDLGGETPLTVSQRIAAFQADINDPDRTALQILENFGPADLMEQYNNAKDDTYWDSAFPSDETVVFSIDDESNTDAVLVTGSSTDSLGNPLGDTSYSFMMYLEDSDNYLIREIYEDPAGTNTMLIRKVEL